MGELIQVKVLDSGYVQNIEHWGSDERIIESARMSTQRGFEGWGVEETCNRCHGSGTNEPTNGPGSLCLQCRGRKTFINKPGDEKLLKFLYDHRHMTPFEMAGMTLEIKAPIFVFREWHRHRTQSYNEMSARYTPLPDENYLPTIERVMINANSANKQAAGREGAPQITEAGARAWLRQLEGDYVRAESGYQSALACGVPKELARLVLPVGRYSKMRASANLRNWLQFLTLRMDSAAQWEIRQYANTVARFIGQTYPRTYALFVGDK